MSTKEGTSFIPYIKIDHSPTENKMLTHEKDDLYVHKENVLCAHQNQGGPCKLKTISHCQKHLSTTKVSPTKPTSEHYYLKQTATQAWTSSIRTQPKQSFKHVSISWFQFSILIYPQAQM